MVDRIPGSLLYRPMSATIKERTLTFGRSSTNLLHPRRQLPDVDHDHLQPYKVCNCKIVHAIRCKNKKFLNIF